MNKFSAPFILLLIAAACLAASAQADMMAMENGNIEVPEGDYVLWEGDEISYIGPVVWTTEGQFMDVGATDHELVFIPQWVLDDAVALILATPEEDHAMFFEWDYWDTRVEFQHIGEHIATPVPLPAGIWLFMSAIAGLLVARRRSSVITGDT